MEYQENSLTYEDYCRLRESVGWQNFSPDQTQNALSRSLYTITAIDDNHAIGMGRLLGDGLYLLIAEIVVHPAYQNKGIGTEILNNMLNRIYEITPDGGRTSVQLISEKGREPFYEKLGFKRIPNDSCGSAMRKVIMK